MIKVKHLCNKIPMNVDIYLHTESDLSVYEMMINGILMFDEIDYCPFCGQKLEVPNKIPLDVDVIVGNSDPVKVTIYLPKEIYSIGEESSIQNAIKDILLEMGYIQIKYDKSLSVFSNK